MDDSALSENLSESDEETMTAAMVLLKIEEVRLILSYHIMFSLIQIINNKTLFKISGYNINNEKMRKKPPVPLIGHL